MRQRRHANGLGQVVEVPAERGPLLARVSMPREGFDGAGVLTLMSSAGRAAITASPKTSEMILGGLFGSGRKMWLISGCLP
jgi:hypothetical protein